MTECPLCGHSELRYQFSGMDTNNHGPGSFAYSRCSGCGVFFINPQPDERELEPYYAQRGYYSLRGVASGGSSVRIRRLLYGLYFRADGKKRAARLPLLPLKTFSRGALIRKGARLLDIGCGSGQFPFEMAHFGVDARGIDPYYRPDADAGAVPVRVTGGRLQDARFASGSFDVITMNHVLEHIPDPLPTLREVHRILSAAGTFIVAVPNFRSLAFRFFRHHWYQVDAPRHLFVYSDTILRDLVSRAGFSIRKTRFNSTPRQFTYSLSNLLSAPALRKVCPILDVLLMPVVYLVNVLGAGDQFEFFCRKAAPDRQTHS